MNLFILDIETTPIQDDPVLEKLLDEKTKSIDDEISRELQKKKYRFLNPIYAKVLAIGSIYVVSDTGAVREKIFYNSSDEKTLLSEFSTYLSNFKGLFIHYNGLDFDVPFLIARMAVHGIQPPSARFCNLTRFRHDIHYDIMQVFSCWKVWGVRLSEICHIFGVESPKDILKGQDVTDFLLTASEDQIKEYVMGDVRSSYEVYKKLSLIIS